MKDQTVVTKGCEELGEQRVSECCSTRQRNIAKREL